MLPELLFETLKDAEERMRGAISALESDLATYRTGRASPHLLDRIVVEMHGEEIPLRQLGLVSVPEPQQLAIQAFDTSFVSAIERAIMTSDLGLMPNTNGKNIFLNLPRLTQQRRIDLTKRAGKRVEDAKVAVRNVRRDALNDIREIYGEKMCTEDEFHAGEKKLDELTGKYVEDIDAIGKQKAGEIMEV